jgi:hypothetical protein
LFVVVDSLDGVAGVVEPVDEDAEGDAVIVWVEGVEGSVSLGGLLAESRDRLCGEVDREPIKVCALTVAVGVGLVEGTWCDTGGDEAEQ